MTHDRILHCAVVANLFNHCEVQITLLKSSSLHERKSRYVVVLWTVPSNLHLNLYTKLIFFKIIKKTWILEKNNFLQQIGT